ncbi:nitrite reductase large subunit NirB [Fulvivirgaceae bacterium BMA10]|uniref:Nitrite reductase large subunit NirB n=1 Tax=Splendidivirga corallicola TaxID=3051826 RepID=A0ABT8KU94_9BACT|nr:nitrite reductase large subunit NirB [Fulvivirgaceae bacterium BMA10]
METGKKSKTKKKNIVVIGNGMVSYKFCEKFVSKPKASSYNLIVLGEEPRPAYDRVHLSEYFNGMNPEKLTLGSLEWYAENDIQLYVGQLATHIDVTNKTVTTDKGRIFTYDKLIMATGSAPFVPAIDGVEKDGVFVYRTIEDLDLMLSYAKRAKKAAVIGGGLLGLEAAKAVKDLGLETHVVEFAPRLMPRQLDDAGARILKEKLEALGIWIHTDKNTTLIDGDQHVSKMIFTDDSTLDVDMIVISAGIVPRDELARKIGLETGPRGGIVVDEKMRSSNPDIYAIGEVALVNNMTYGLVGPGYDMAEVVVKQLLTGEETSFSGADLSTKLKLIGVDVASFGDAFCEQEGRSIVYEDRAKGIYKRINITEDGKYILGGILVGDAEDYNMLLQRVTNRIKLPENPEELILGPRGSDGNSGMGVMDLPDEALICTCENITKGTICDLIKAEKVNDISGIKACTKAGTGCGGCAPMLNDLYTETLKSMGKEVKKRICEHLELSRQELYHLVKINGLRTYNEVLDNFGQGDGCEICKPVVASVLASLWNDVIQKQCHIQDTNDRFLANIQRGGSYSVVPRVPGGEITPDKLIVIGELAKKYDLYCKITGGQRIDLFGAKVNDLPKIWEELVEAGFESGHAYGKALRTVKSCVGSTWCRYGVQDSVSFAIEVENRYKGLRSPHKLKSAVSGCTRECAEAQSKDFGIIATDKGWNLYVCGNGGTKPQHAVLLAADLDKETCILYIDRFLMFYIKTAEPLQRTAPWFNKLEGGIDYLRDVIIHDSLGICEELEKQMAHHVATYHCEWKEVVENEERRKPFKHYANSEEEDETLEFVDVRGQKIPAPWD